MPNVYKRIEIHPYISLKTMQHISNLCKDRGMLSLFEIIRLTKIEAYDTMKELETLYEKEPQLYFTN